MNARDRPIDTLKCLGIEFKKISDYGFLVYRKEGNMFNEMNKTGNLFENAPKHDDFISTIEFQKKRVDNGDWNKPCGKTDKGNPIYAVHGYFFFETVHGDSGALILDDCNLYIPKHLLKLFKDMNEENIQAVKDGKLGITLYEYDSKKRADCVGINLVDL